MSFNTNTKKDDTNKKQNKCKKYIKLTISMVCKSFHKMTNKIYNDIASKHLKHKRIIITIKQDTNQKIRKSVKRLVKRYKGFRKKQSIKLKPIKSTLSKHSMLMVLLVIGAICTSASVIVNEMNQVRLYIAAIGITLIGGSSIALYMMYTTDVIAKKLYARFDKMDATLERQTVVLTENHKELMANHNEILVNQKDNHKEMIDVLKEIKDKLPVS